MKIRHAIMLSLAASTILSAPLFAQEPDPGHPRINQIDNCVDSQENNTNNSGRTNSQKARDDRQDQRVQNQLSRDESEHRGHITKGEQRHLNKEMNKERREKRRQERRDHAHKG